MYCFLSSAFLGTNPTCRPSMRMKSSSSHLNHPEVRYLVYTTCPGNSMGRREMGNSRKHFSLTSTTFHLSSSRLWQAVNKQDIAYYLCFTQDPRKWQVQTTLQVQSRQDSCKRELNLLTAIRNNFQRGPQCNSHQRYSLINSFSIFNHKPVACCHTMKKSSI